MSECESSPTVRVVKKGRLIRDGERIVEASSTISLVEAGKHRIVVDTGDIADHEETIRAFESIDVSFASVEAIINTHYHRDHIGGNDLFTNARTYAHQLEEPPAGTVRLTREMVIIPGVTVVPTPGHTQGSVSVFVEGRRKCAISGDAIPTKANYEAHVPPFVNIDPKLALKSMEAILAWADVVVPGHDALFEVLRSS